MSNQSAEAVFDALGEPVRRRILELLHTGPTPVGELAQRLPVGRPAVSKHLRVLEGAGLIEHRSVGTKNLYVSGAGPGYEDDILIHKDKNSNTRGVLELAPEAKAFEALIADVTSARVTHVLALGSATPRNTSDDLGTLKGLRGLVTIASNEGPLSDAAHVTLPAATWAEASGTYVNAKGMKQVSEKAIDLLGSARPAWEQVAQLARALGYETTWAKLKDIRARLGLDTPAPNAQAKNSLSAGPEQLGTTAD